MENYYENAMIAAEFRKSNEGESLGGYIAFYIKLLVSCLKIMRKKFVALNTLDTLNSNALPINMNLFLQLIIHGIMLT